MSESRDPRLDEAYRQTTRDEPPAELDERIRAAARRAVDARPQSLPARAAADRRRSWSVRWRVPLSIAATVLIAATLTLMVQEEERRPREEAPAPATSTDRMSAPAAKPEAARRDASPSSSGTSTTSMPQSPAVPLEEQRSSTRPSAPTPPQSLEKRREQAVEAERNAAPTAPPSAAAPSGAAASAADGAASRAAQPASEAVTALPPKAAAPPPAMAPAAPEPANRLSQPLSRDRELGDRPARAMRESPLARSPEEWIAEIRRLKAQGREADATAELAEFRRRYPDYVLPTDLAR